MSNQRKPEVSVIIPAYNGARYICECIESVLNQTYRHFEIIVIDDGSTDNTREVLEPYIRNSSIRYFYQDNAGPGAARNFGIKYAQGSYISFCDQDDWYEKDSLEHRLNLYEKHPELGLVCSDFLTAFMTNDYNEVVYGESYVKELNLLERIPNACIETKEKNVYIFNMNVFPEMILAPFVWIGTMMIHKEVFDKVGIFDEKLRWSADTDIQIRIFTITGQLVRTIDRPNLSSGMHTGITWDGRNDRGSIVLNGVYLCQLQIQEKEGARRSLKYMIKIAFIK